MPRRMQLVIDCHAPDRLMPFWATALGYVPAPPPQRHETWRSYYLAIGEPGESLEGGDYCDRLIDPEGVGPDVWFQVVPEEKTTKNRLHLDLHVTDRSAPWAGRRHQLLQAVERLTDLGGVIRGPIPVDEAAHLTCGVNDPEGNELCLV